VAGRRTVFLVLDDDPPRWRSLGLWAITAASVGESVDVLVTARPLRALARGAFDAPDAEAASLGLPSPRELLAQAKALAPVRIVTCDTEARLAGLSDEEARASVDDVVSLPSFWRELGSARVVTV
jgi:peroxiredoxin family protein